MMKPSCLGSAHMQVRRLLKRYLKYAYCDNEADSKIMPARPVDWKDDKGDEQ